MLGAQGAVSLQLAGIGQLEGKALVRALGLRLGGSLLGVLRIDLKGGGEGVGHLACVQLGLADEPVALEGRAGARGLRLAHDYHREDARVDKVLHSVRDALDRVHSSRHEVLVAAPQGQHPDAVLADDELDQWQRRARAVGEALGRLDHVVDGLAGVPDAPEAARVPRAQVLGLEHLGQVTRALEDVAVYREPRQPQGQFLALSLGQRLLGLVPSHVAARSDRLKTKKQHYSQS